MLFLEHIYTSGLKKSEETAAKEMVVALATQKAEELDAVAVLSNQYRGCYPSGRYVSAPIYIYISKSKNGRQYLDSLGGAAVTLAEEQYKQESFFRTGRTGPSPCGMTGGFFMMFDSILVKYPAVKNCCISTPYPGGINPRTALQSCVIRWSS